MRARRAALRRITVVLAAGTLLAGTACATSGAESSIDWAACPEAPEGSAARCARVEVPVDWSRPDESERLSLRVAKLPAEKPRQRIGTLLFNPGGPGGAAAPILQRPRDAEAYFPQRLRDRFDIVGIDPRGVGGSRLVRCAERPHEPAVTRFPSNERQSRALATHNASFAESCRAESGALAAHLDTASVARDFDAVRHRLGAEKISFLGLSYGTMLAQSYAELFPERLRALVLDGVVDRSLGWRQLVRDNAVAAQDGVNQFASWCASQAGCRLAGARRTIERVLADADAGRLTAHGREVTAEEVALAVNYSLNMADARTSLAKALRTARDSGDAGALLDRSPFALPTMYSAYRAIICQDVPAPAGRELTEQVGEVRELGPSLRGTSEFWSIVSGCVGWPGSSEWRPHPWRVPDDFVPSLLISGAHDVATPRAWAESVHQRLPGSRLVRWDGFGHTAWLNAPEPRAKAISYLLETTG